MLFIPNDPGQVTADWLGHVLSAPVRACRVVDAHAGTTGRAVVEVDYAGSGPGPRRLFVKLPPQDEQQRAFVESTGMGRREAMFYRRLSAEVPVRVPQCYRADWDDSGAEYIMLLEHLEDSGCTFRAASLSYSLSYVRAVLAAFAALHARYWRSPRFDSDLDAYGDYRPLVEVWQDGGEIVGSMAYGVTANEHFRTSFDDVIEIFVSTYSVEAASAAAQQLCIEAGICD